MMFGMRYILPTFSIVGPGGWQNLGIKRLKILLVCLDTTEGVVEMQLSSSKLRAPRGCKRRWRSCGSRSTENNWKLQISDGFVDNPSFHQAPGANLS
jgi:hypothetical protein